MKKVTMYNILILSTLLLFVPFHNDVRAVKKPEESITDDLLCRVQNYAFQDGEEFTFKVYYNWNFVWLSAGELTFKVKDQGEKYLFTARGRTYDSYDWFFKVRDYYAVWVDKETLLPRTSIRDIQEGGYRLYDKMFYDHENRKITSYRGRTEETAQKIVHDVDDCIHDMLSILFYVRNMDYTSMKKGDQFPVRIFMDKESYILKGTFEGRETKYIKGVGDFKTVRIAPEMVTGTVFNDPNQMKVWATDDANHLPLLVETPLSLGTAKIVLKSYKNLKHPLSSKVN